MTDKYSSFKELFMPHKKLTIFIASLLFLSLISLSGRVMAQDAAEKHVYYPFADKLVEGTVLEGYLDLVKSLDGNYYVIKEGYVWGGYHYDHYFYFKVDPPYDQALDITICIYYYCEEILNENFVVKIYDYKHGGFVAISRSAGFREPGWWNITISSNFYDTTNYIDADGKITIYIDSLEGDDFVTIHYDYFGIIVSLPASFKDTLYSKISELEQQISNLEQQMLDLQEQLRLKDAEIAEKNKTIIELNSTINKLYSKISELEAMLTPEHFIMRGDLALTISLIILLTSTTISLLIIRKAGG
jgi:hypothetical protein